MSKASEWSALVAHKRPYFDEGFLRAEVNDFGDLAIFSEAQAHSRDRALNFARWILATFDEVAP